jgi:hypothetical protein
MKIFLFFLLFSTCLMHDWVDYSNEDYHFEIKLPEGYEIDQDEVDREFAFIKNIRIVGVIKGWNGPYQGVWIYRVISEKYEKKPIVTEQKIDFSKLIIEYLKLMNESSYIANKMAIVSKTESKDNLYYISTNDSLGLIEHRNIIVNKNISYSMSILCRKEFLKDELVDSFFTSLKIID